MDNIYGIIENGKVIIATDGNGCYDVSNGKCYCAECYYYGYDSVNCAYAHLTKDDGLIPITWDKEKNEFVLADPNE